MKFKIGFLVGSLLLSYSVLFCAEGEANNFNQEKITQLNTWREEYEESEGYYLLERGNQRKVGVLNEMQVFEFSERSTMSLIIGDKIKIKIKIEYVYDLNNLLQNPDYAYLIDNSWNFPNGRKISSETIGFLWPILGYKIPKNVDQDAVGIGKEIWKNIYGNKERIKITADAVAGNYVYFLNKLLDMFAEWYQPNNEEYNENKAEEYRNKQKEMKEAEEKKLQEEIAQKQKEEEEKEKKNHPKKEELRCRRLAFLQKKQNEGKKDGSAV